MDIDNILLFNYGKDFTFPERNTFRKYFKAHTGFSPSEYRKEILK